MACVGGRYAAREFASPPFDEPGDREQQLSAARQFIIVNLLQKVCAFYDSTPGPFLAQALEYINVGILNPEWQPFLQNPEWQTNLADTPNNGVKDSKLSGKVLDSLMVRAPLPRSSPYIGFHRHSPPCGRFGRHLNCLSCCSSRKKAGLSRTATVSARDRTPLRPLSVPKAKSSTTGWTSDCVPAPTECGFKINRSPSIPTDILVPKRICSDIVQMYPRLESSTFDSDDGTEQPTPRLVTSIGDRLGIGAPMTGNLSIFERDFVFIRTLGRGAFGVVYEVQNKLDLKKYAVKVVMFNTHNVGMKNMALREVQSWSKARHPHVCRYAHAWVEPGWALEMFAQAGYQASDDTYQRDQGMPAFESSVQDYPQRMLSDRFRETDTESSVCGSDFDDDSSLVAFEDDDNDLGCHTVQLRTMEPEPSHTDRMAFPQTLFIQMELCQDNLGEWCRAQRNIMSPCDMNDEQMSTHAISALTIFGQMLSALEHIHELGMVHRDIKPSNIFRATDDCWVLGDFGLSKSIHDSDDVAKFPFGAHESGIVGTAAYAAPEQLNGGKVTTAADMFAMGLVLLEKLMLFDTMHERAQSFLLVRKDRKVPDTRLMRCFPTVGAFILAVTSPDPADRPSAASLLSALSPWRRSITRELQVFCLKAKVEPRDVWQLPMRSPALLTTVPTLDDTEFAPLDVPLSVTECGVQTD